MHILFIWEQGLGYGHLGHLYPIARAARAKGHRTTLAVRHMENVWAAGDVPFDTVLPAPSVRPANLGQETRTFSDVIRPSGFANPRQLTACTRGWLQLFDLLRPDALVCEHAYNAVFAARVRQLPVARVGTGFSVPPVGNPSPPMRVWLPHAVEECRAADTELLAVMQQASEQLDGPACESVTDLLGYGEEFLATWPELDHLGIQEGRFYYGPMLGLSGRAGPDWPAGDGPRVFMYLSEDHPHQDHALRALGQLGWPVIFHARKRPEFPLGESIAYSAEPVDVHAVLKDADILINHGSHGTCADALRHGAAMFLLPNTFERSQVAYRLGQQGLARTPGRDISTDGFISVLRSLVADPLPNTRRMQERYQAYDPDAAAHELAEDLETWLTQGADA